MIEEYSNLHLCIAIAIIFVRSVPLAQLVERRSHNPEVVSSILTGGTSLLATISWGPYVYSVFFAIASLPLGKFWSKVQQKIVITILIQFGEPTTGSIPQVGGQKGYHFS